MLNVIFMNSCELALALKIHLLSSRTHFFIKAPGKSKNSNNRHVHSRHERLPQSEYTNLIAYRCSHSCLPQCTAPRYKHTAHVIYLHVCWCQTSDVRSKALFQLQSIVSACATYLMLHAPAPGSFSPTSISSYRSNAERDLVILYKGHPVTTDWPAFRFHVPSILSSKAFGHIPCCRSCLSTSSLHSLL